MSPMKKIVIIAALCAALAGVAWYASKMRPGARPSVIFIVLDTLRADHLGLYGYERGTSPNLNRFANESVVFDYAITSAPWTPPALGSMFTGKYASSHGMMPPNGRGKAREASATLDQQNTTMAEIFKANGYQTAGITPNPWIKDEFGYAQGFDSYFYRDRGRADEINRAGKKVLDTMKPNSPFFLFLHYLDPHDPYDPPSPYDKQFSGALRARSYDPDTLEKLNRYDGEIAFMDHHLGELFSDLRRRGLWDNSIIVIISDHGEQFRERGELGHGFRLYDEELHVLLMVHAPGIEPGRVKDVVNTVDVLPTILDLTQVAPPPGLQGVSLINQSELKKRSGVLSEIDRKHNWKSFTNPQRERIILDFGAADDGDLRGESPALVGVFNSVTDPAQTQAIQDPQLTRELQLEFDSLYGKVSENQLETKAVEIKSDTLDQLKSLGYMK